jgi:DNA polymerase-1
MSDLMGFDIETTGLRHDERGAKILTAAAWSPDTTANATHLDDYIERIEWPIIQGGYRLAGQNIIGFDIPWWWAHVAPNYDIDVWDTQVAQSLINEESRDNSLLGNALHWNVELEGVDFDKLIQMKNQRTHLADTPLQDVMEYNIMDAILSFRVAEQQRIVLTESGQLDFFYRLMDIGVVLAKMMWQGVLVDKAFATDQRNQAEYDLERLERKILYMADAPELNIGSTQQLGKLLFEDLGMPVMRKTRKGQPSTASAPLKQLRAHSENEDVKDFLSLILEHREKKKLIGTYYDPMLNKLTGKDGRVRTTYHLGRSKYGGTVTGRLSSSKPNLQNVPRDKKVKGMFIPSMHYMMYDADYSQIELRVAAWYSGEASMLSAFADGLDIHTATLADMEGIEYVTALANVEMHDEWKEKRANVKRVNFLILYGGGPNTLVELSRDVGAELTHTQAKDLMTRWYAARPQLSQWIEDTKAAAIVNRQLETPTGRVRHLPYAGDGGQEGGRQLRQGVNFMVQSLASDIMLLALQQVDGLDNWFHMRYGPKPYAYHRTLMTVHDSVIGEFFHDIDEDDQKHYLYGRMVSNVKDIIEHEYGITGLPLEVDITTGMSRWGESI